MNVKETVTKMILEKMKDGIVPWQSPYLVNGMHRNLVSGEPYHGINILTTWLSGFRTPYWVSFKQAKELGGSVNKGAESTMIVFFKLVESKKTKDMPDKDKQWYPIYRYTPMFNVEQCTLPEGVVPEETTVVNNPIDECEAVIQNYKNSGITYNIGPYGCARYSPSLDIITMPGLNSMTSAEEYYSTFFHEMIHSTRHESRLNRTIDDKKGRAVEELIAEIGSSILCARSGMEFKVSSEVFSNQVAYIQNWISHLENDSNLIISAASKANAAADFIYNITAQEAVA